MTPEQHAQRIRQLQLQLEIADYGLAMPRDYQRVLELRVQLEEAKKEPRPCAVCGRIEPEGDCCIEAGATS